MSVRGVEASVIGKFTNSKKCIVKFKGKIIVDIDLKFLHDGLPPRPMKTKLPKIKYSEPKIHLKKDLTITLKKLLNRPNISGFEFISSQYDYEVQGSSVLKPLQGAGRVNGESAVVRPVLHSNRGVVVSQGLYPSYSQINCYHMAACSIDTAIRNVITAGANPKKNCLIGQFLLVLVK